MNSTKTRYEYCLSEAEQIIDHRSFTVYGIAVYRKDGDVCPADPVREVPGISLSRSQVTQLAERCNRLQPSLLHLDDIIEDSLP